MQFRVAVEGNGPGNWEVRVSVVAATATVGSRPLAAAPLKDAAGIAIVRRLGAVGGDPAMAFPLPPASEVAAMDPADPHTPLCQATTTDALEELLVRVVTRAVRGNDLEAFGRFLFATLIGDAAWAAIDAAAPGEWIDLVLAFPPTLRAFTRLPWELMRKGADFLVALPQVSIVREVAGTEARLGRIERTPRVLFVVGTELNKDVVRPGAEYLHLIRGLRARQLNLETHLVCSATAERVKTAVAEFLPDVVHFICHGGVDANGEPYLDLMDENNASKAKPAYAGSLEQMIQAPGGRMPRMIVLSACYTASAFVSRVGQVATPLAAQLVEKKVPVVVAMAGPIADQACRLFTRQFYDSMVAPDDVAHAAALGRLAAIRSGGVDPRTSVDWVFPTIFVAGGLGSPSLEIALSDEDQRRQRRWNELIAQGVFGTQPVFCDRLGVFERFDLLMAERASQSKLSGSPRVVNVLALEVPAKDEDVDAALPLAGSNVVPRQQFGRSWLLRELALKAWSDGHLPILVSPPRGKEPKTYDELLDVIVRNTRFVLATLGEETLQFDALNWLRGRPEAAGAPPAWLATHYVDDLRQNRAAPETRGKALRFDLLRLLETVRRTCRPSADERRCRLVLLVDDVHRMGEAAEALMQYVIGQVGLGLALDDIRIVFAWASTPRVGEETAVAAIAEWLRDKPALSKIVIERFGRPLSAPASPDQLPLEERLAYEYFLLHRSLAFPGWNGVAVRAEPGNRMAAGMFWRLVAREANAVPSRLDFGVREALSLIETEQDAKELFQPADDDNWLSRTRAFTR